MRTSFDLVGFNYSTRLDDVFLHVRREHARHGDHRPERHGLGRILQGAVEVYKRETHEVIRRFLLRQLSFRNTIAALDAALAGVLPRLKPEQLDEVRAAMLANNEKVMEEMARRAK